MDTIAVILIVVGALILLALVFGLVRNRLAARRAERERLAREASDHRQQADANVSKARVLGDEADTHREAAEHHAALADQHAQQAESHAATASELEERVEGAGRAAGFHDEKATEREEKLN